MVTAKAIPYIPKHGGRALGINAEAIPLICDVWLKAREIGVLRQSQRHLCEAAEIIMRGLAHVGIIALVDEATGYQYDRDRDALAKILEAFVAKELRKWVKTFPPDFYREMFRLRGWEFPDTAAKPPLVGKLTDNVVYQRLAPGVRDELRSRNPSDEKGRRRHKHHQYLTENVGFPRLREHLASVTSLMKISKNWKDFLVYLEKVHPKYNTTMQLPFDE